MKEVYIVGAAGTVPATEAQIREAFEADELELRFGEEGNLVSVIADGTRVDVRYEARSESLGWTPELLSGTAEAREALETAQGFYRVSLEVGQPQGPVAVFEALWTVRAVMEIIKGGVAVDVTAYKLHLPQDVEEITELEFDIRDHVTIHAVEALEGEKPMWLHTHGMAKFGTPDVELFHVGEDDLAAAESFFHELCMDMAFGHGPAPRAPMTTSVGLQFTLLPSGEARNNLYGVDQEVFEGHEVGFLSAVSPEGRHSMAEMLSHYRERFEKESDEEAEELQAIASRLLPSFKARFQRRGLMEPITFLVRAPFDVHPDGLEGAAQEEQLWVDVVAWDESALVGKLVDGGQRTTEWRKGAHVEIDEGMINAVAVARGGRPMEIEEMEALLMAERPA